MKDIPGVARVAVVTGAGSGIGRAVALRLAARQTAIVLCGRRAEPLHAAASEIAAAGAVSLVLSGDVSNPAFSEEVVTGAAQSFGRIDFLINNAGYAPNIRLPDLTPQQWQNILNTNLSAAFYLSRACWPLLTAAAGHGAVGGSTPRPRSAIINISSESARDPFPGLAAYGIAKVGLNLLTKTLAAEGAPHGIGVYGIAPSAVETPMLRTLVSPEQLPTDHTLSPDDVAETVLACLDGGLRYASGETIFVHRRI